MKYIIILLNFFVLTCIGQTITPSVINSGGKTTTTTINTQTIIYSDNIGEAIIGTGSSAIKMLTQGFLQPEMIVLAGATVTTFTNNVSCADKGDGSIRVDIANLPPGATVQYFWTPSALCPNNDCSRMDSLSKGTFTVLTVITQTMGSVVKKDSTRKIIDIKDDNGPCNIKVYTGISLSSGNNTKFVIDNIELYPKAKVCIYNRWGGQLFCTQEYSNTKNYWPRDGEKVNSGTYFFIIDLGDKGIIKKWLEVFE